MHFSLLIISALIFVGCQTAPLSTQTTDVGLWEGKVQLINKETNHKTWAYVNWASDSTQQRLRVDVRAILDIPVATFLLSENKAHLWLYRENKYYTSLQPEKLFSKLVKFKFNPKIFFSFLGHPQNIGEGWECHKKVAQMSCSHSNEPLKVRIDFEEVDSRKIKITKPRKAFVLRLRRSKVEVKDRMFKPLSSSQFESIEI